MPKLKISIHKEGRRFLAILLFLLIIGNLTISWFLPERTNILYFSWGISVALFSFVAYFFRNPPRFIVAESRNVLAPADGKIVVIEEVEETEYFKDKRIQISIFMSPANVHVNRTPIGGIVKYVKYHSGKYLVAWHPKSSTKNERNTIVIEEDEIEILVRQIAGALARRIVNYLNEGDKVAQGHELGFIKFGSRVDVFLPLGSEVLVHLNQKVKGGESVIAKLV